MGTITGKKVHRGGKLTAKKANKQSKIPGLPSPKPLKKPKKDPSKDKGSTIDLNLPGITPNSTLTISPKPYTKIPGRTKWPALFKKHLGVIESHIRNLERMMQSIKSEMEKMDEKERMEWELGERGTWRVMCEMMDRAREVLASAREAAKGILPPQLLKDKKGLGVVGTSFEPLGPKLKQKAADLGYDAKGKGKIGRNPDEIDSEFETILSSSNSGSAESSDSSADNEEDQEEAEAGSVTGGDDFVSLNIGAKIPRLNGTIEKEPMNGAIEPNPFFVIDIEPTPVNLTSISSNGPTQTKPKTKETKKEKKSRLAAEREDKNAQRKKMGKQKRKEQEEREQAAEAATNITAAAPNPERTKSKVAEIDFSAIEAKLQAEIAAGTKAKSESEIKRKRRRSSGGVDEVETKKVKKDVVVEEVVVKKDKKRKANEEEGNEGAEEDVAEKKKTKKEKRYRSEVDASDEKKVKIDRKRKADSEEPIEEVKKKKRKHTNEEEP